MAHDFLKVYLEAGTAWACLQHAFSTEREEIMGLLIGEVDESQSSIHVQALTILQRSDKRADRVEIGPEQLTHGLETAESLARELNRPLRVVGWYHSHPHITVLPSDVDLRTQWDYQQYTDPTFVGVIISCFSTDKRSWLSRNQIICFQTEKADVSGSPQYHCAQIPIFIERPPHHLARRHLAPMTRLPRILSTEEGDAFAEAVKGTRLNGQQDVMDNVMATVHNSAVFTKSVCQLMSVVVGPQLQTLETRLHRARQRRSELIKERERLTDVLRPPS